MSHGTTAFARVRVLWLALSLTALTMLLLACAGNASAAFKPTGFSATPTNMQAGGHGNLGVTTTLDGASGEASNDDLRELKIDLPAGQLFNPRAVSATCSDSQYGADACPAASLVGSVAIKYRMFGSNKSAVGSVYMRPATSDSPLNFAFIVRPSGLAKWFFQSSKVSGFTSVRQGLDADYGLSVTIPQIPYLVKDGFGFQYPITLYEVGLTFNAKAPSGKYFVFNPTRCDAARAQAQLTSSRGEVSTLVSSWAPSGCSSVPFTPNLVVSPTTSTVGAPTGINATYSSNTDDAAIQSSHLRNISVGLAAGTTINLDVLNATGLCSDDQLAAGACPATSRIGDAVVDVPFLTSKLTGGIFLTSFDGVKFGVVINGPNGTQAIFRGSARPGNMSGASRIIATFTDLPQVPYSSAQLNFTSKLVNNPDSGCPSSNSVAEAAGYSGAASTQAPTYPLTGCVPNTILTSGVTSPTRNNRPSVSFTSDIAGATFKCKYDATAWVDCASPYQAPTALADGDHRYYVRAFYGGIGDYTPLLLQFTVDTQPPVLNWTAPTAGSTVYGDSVKFEWTTEAGETSMCALLPDVTLESCTPGRTYTGVTPGDHTAFVAVRDAAGNVKSQFRTITVAAMSVDPEVTISSPTSGQQLVKDRVTAEFTATSPVGSEVWRKSCAIEQKYGNNWIEVDSAYTCESPYEFRNLPPNAPLRLKVIATDDEMRETNAYVEFTSGQRDPLPINIDDGPNSVATNDRTPTFLLSYFTDSLYPDAQHLCDFVRPGATFRDWKPCGASSFTSPTNLADGDWKFVTQSVSGSRQSAENSLSFSVAPWNPSYSATVTDPAAGAHPDLDVNIEVPAGQMRKVDMLFPRGLIGSLNSFAQCGAAIYQNPRNCPASSLIGNVMTSITMQGLTPKDLPGSVYLTEPQVAGDVAGIVIIVPKPVSNYGDVVIPMRMQLVNNASQMRVFSDSIPTQVYRTDEEVNYDYYVHWFKLHLNGSQGSPFPLLTNPSSCAAGVFATTIGAFDGEDSPTLEAPFQATRCDQQPFAPTFLQTYSNPNAVPIGMTSQTGLKANLAFGANASSVKRVTAVEPAIFRPNFPSFGDNRDRCAASAIADVDPTSAFKWVFNYSASLCPASSRVGTLSIVSPLLPETLHGDVYFVNAGSLPRLGVKIDQLGISMRLAGITSVGQQACDEAVYDLGCPDQIVVDFNDIPDLPFSSFELNLDETSRPNFDGTKQLSSKLLTVVEADDPYICRPVSLAETRVTSWSGRVEALRQEVALNGCNQP